MTGENVKPAYGGEEEAFLSKVVTPIYNMIAKVLNAIIVLFSYIV
jgi:callose synthase